jgi:hypothetical protein
MSAHLIGLSPTKKLRTPTLPIRTTQPRPDINGRLGGQFPPDPFPGTVATVFI